MDGSVELFNQTVKRMWRWVVVEEGIIWDLLLPYICRHLRIYTVQAPVQTVTSGSDRSAKEKQPSPFRLVNDYSMCRKCRNASTKSPERK